MTQDGSAPRVVLADALGGDGRVMDGKRRRDALAALEALDLSLAFHKELVRRMEEFPACQAEANQLEAQILISEAATEHLIREHLPYVRRFASRNVDEGEDPEDVFQVAIIGLQRSTRRFDPERGYRFLIYATYWMRQAITRWRADEGAAIRIDGSKTGLELPGIVDQVWSKAPVIVGAHDTGPLIRSKDGFWLAIPLPAAGKSLRGAGSRPANGSAAVACACASSIAGRARACWSPRGGSTRRARRWCRARRPGAARSPRRSFC
ncbi:RNA polymerase sigma factor (sigma-70 family) [Rhodovulum steppense]|uniref:RNA polymerase sigma factor (Sigma-70 family) n=1 Tax=Rhodovulum steppense TaxID=540251 RepID=A0A4R1YYL4_9RHOB|nr:RNA polymerase sigma factor (sigma-70 family) [Rhodovulum steppense]